MCFLQKVKRPYSLSYSRKKVHINELSKPQKSQFWVLKSFFQKSSFNTFLMYDSLSSCKKSEKIDELFLRSCIANGQTHECMDG